MVDPVSDRVSRVPPYLGAASTSSIYFAYGGFTLFARLSQNLSAINWFSLNLSVLRRCSPSTPLKGLGSSNFARRYFRNLFWFLFLELLRWFSSLSIALLPYFIQVRNVSITTDGLPHSAISGSQDVCSSPKLFAAYHGLLRLTAPLGIHHKPILSLDHIIVPSFSFSKNELIS